MGRLLTFGHADWCMYEHPELGGSLYDTHADGSGVCYSSRLRPVLNLCSALPFVARWARVCGLSV
jgi:N,N-dimethylformamidase